MKHTNTNEFNAKVKAYLIPIIEEHASDYDETTNGKPFTWALKTAKNEVAFEFNRKGDQGGLEYWLSGLALNIAYMNSEILELVEKWHECKLTEKEESPFVENWFKWLAAKMLQCARKEV